MKTILIADEDERVKNVVRLMFEHMGYEIVATSGGVDTILKTKEMKPDVVLADVSLSDKNGYAISREIKNNPLLKNTPVILLTSSLGTFDETKAVEARADDFILKPFIESREITKKVESLISQNQERKRRFSNAMVMILIILVVIIPILYQSVSNITKVESKLMPPAEKEKKIVVTVNNDEGELSRKEEPLRVKEERPKVKDEEPIIKEEATKKDIAAVLATQMDGRYTVQVGAFQREEKARGIAELLASKGYLAFIKTAEIPGKGSWYVVRIGTFETRQEAKLYGDNLKGREPLVEMVIVKTYKKKKKETTFEEVKNGVLKEMQKKVERKTVADIKKLNVKKLELITKPVLASESKQPEEREVSGKEEIKAPQLEEKKEPTLEDVYRLLKDIQKKIEG